MWKFVGCSRSRMGIEKAYVEKLLYDCDHCGYTISVSSEDDLPDTCPECQSALMTTEQILEIVKIHEKYEYLAEKAINGTYFEEHKDEYVE